MSMPNAAVVADDDKPEPRMGGLRVRVDVLLNSLKWRGNVFCSSDFEGKESCHARLLVRDGVGICSVCIECLIIINTVFVARMKTARVLPDAVVHGCSFCDGHDEIERCRRNGRNCVGVVDVGSIAARDNCDGSYDASPPAMSPALSVAACAPIALPSRCRHIKLGVETTASS